MPMVTMARTMPLDHAFVAEPACFRIDAAPKRSRALGNAWQKLEYRIMIFASPLLVAGWRDRVDRIGKQMAEFFVYGGSLLHSDPFKQPAADRLWMVK